MLANLFAQVANDECDTPIVIKELSNWCSNPGEFTSEGAQPSRYDAPDCFSGDFNDVWFSFVAGASEVTIVVIGNTSRSPGGTLDNPEVALYTGDCTGEIIEWRCATDATKDNTVEIIRGGLVVGETYHIRVQGRNGSTGTFQLCINNYNPPAIPGNDFNTASILCDKSPFSVQQTQGGGVDNNEAAGTCLEVQGPSESSSTWFAWTAKTSGPLTFTITPLRGTDDIDFAVYRLPNGVQDPTGKQALRCMAAACIGATGLDLQSTDTTEDFGCDPGEDNFVRFIDMVAGDSYGLIINNFSDTGDGFSIEFGDDPTEGEFEGPSAEFTSDEPDNQVCVGEDIAFTDVSAFPNGQITKYTWTFGVGASPSNAEGPGPHSVIYNSPGVKSVVLTLETNLGCQLTRIENFDVLPEMEINPILTTPDCGGGTNGAIELQITGGARPLLINWNNTTFEADAFVLDSLAEGTYSCVVQDSEGCTKELTFPLFEPGPALNSLVEPVILPTCNGDDDGRIIIAATEGTPPYQYDFGSGLSTDSISNGLAAGTYAVYVVDAEGCDSDFNITVEDPPLLTIDVDPMDISCNGLTDGNAIATTNGGVLPHNFTWSTGSSGPEVTGLPEGAYSISVVDQNGCVKATDFTITEPEGMDLRLVEAIDPICNGTPGGSILMEGMGGTPPYEFAVNGGNFQTSPLLDMLFAGTYTATIRDSEGCTFDFVENITLNEPPPIMVDAGPDQTIDLGQFISLSATSFDAEITYSWSGPDSLVRSDQQNTTAVPFNSGYYTVTIRNEDECFATDSMQVTVNLIRPLYAPNAFSPNGDGRNDQFTLYSGFAARQIKSLRVFSRWGDLLFETTNIPLNDERLGWDGTAHGEPLNAGVYAYFAEVTFLDGVDVIFEGDIALIR